MPLKICNLNVRKQLSHLLLLSSLSNFIYFQYFNVFGEEKKNSCAHSLKPWMASVAWIPSFDFIPFHILGFLYSFI